jgi:hypothetical protein
LEELLKLKKKELFDADAKLNETAKNLEKVKHELERQS